MELDMIPDEKDRNPPESSDWNEWKRTIFTYIKLHEEKFVELKAGQDALSKKLDKLLWFLLAVAVGVIVEHFKK